MTRKDYINLSNAIRATNARIQNDEQAGKTQHAVPEQLRGVRRAAAAICDALADDNPRFDQSQFLKACGYGGEVRATQPAPRAERLPDVNSY